jgi:predicted PurR-regulated permease PerM
VAALYFGKPILLPLALAVLISFVLAAAVKPLEKLIPSRTFCVLAVMAVTLAAVSAVGWVVSNQLLDVINQLPHYAQNIRGKLDSLRGPKGGSLAKASESVQELSKELSTNPVQKQSVPSNHQPKALPQSPAPVPVTLVEPPPGPLAYIRNLIGPMLEPAASALIVIVFTLVLLIKREDLRDRMLRLIGISQLTLATEAFDDATQRVSSYLRMQSVVNTVFAAVVFVAWQLVGLPGALLWGVLAGLLRFLPYIGPMAGGGLPFILSLAVFDNWMQPLLTLGVFLAAELLTAYLIEPWLYGRHTGISALAILVAAAFWVAIWGPTGLILSMPLTVCLVVLGRYVPQFEFLSVLLGDEPVLPAQAQFYQRLLAMDQFEARAIMNEFLKDRPVVELYDNVFIPALSLAETDRHRGTLDKVREEFIMESMGEFIAELSETEETPVRPVPTEWRILCLPAKDQADELAAAMLAQLLELSGIHTMVLPPGGLPAEILETKSAPATLLCISAVPPFAVLNARSVSRKLQARFPDLKILVGIWNVEANRKEEDRIEKNVPGDVASTLAQAIERIRELLDTGSMHETPVPAGSRQ